MASAASLLGEQGPGGGRVLGWMLQPPLLYKTHASENSASVGVSYLLSVSCQNITDSSCGKVPT